MKPKQPLKPSLTSGGEEKGKLVDLPGKPEPLALEPGHFQSVRPGLRLQRGVQKARFRGRKTGPTCPYDGFSRVVAG